MKPDFDYDSVPYNFIHCLNSQCPRADECLRQQIVLHIPVECKTINIINPAYAAASNGNCHYFLPDQMQLFARGITHLLDNIAHNDAIILKQQIYNYFQRNSYYRIRNKERLIKPNEQKYIRQLFLSKGITEEPVYDEYVEQYEW